jgi:hypothetical protein
MKLNNKKKYKKDAVVTNEIVDKIIELFPELKKNKTLILSEVLSPKDKDSGDYLLEKIIVNEKSFYKDRYRCILDENINLVGIWEFKDGSFMYYIFDDEFKKINYELHQPIKLK